MFRKVGSPGYLSFPCFSIAWGLATCLENCRYEGNVDDVDAKGPPCVQADSLLARCDLHASADL